MITLQQGMNIPLQANLLKIPVDFAPEKINGNDVDISAFLLAENGKVRSDDDFIFYNQPTSKDGSVTLITNNGKQHFEIDTTKISADIKMISFAITIHGNGSFSQATSLAITVEGAASFTPVIANMQERALVLAELYNHKGVWKFRAVGRGFNGGLAPLATNFGVDIADDGGADEGMQTPVASTPPPVQTAPTPPPTAESLHKVNLQKRIISLEKKNPKLVSLVKKAGGSLAAVGLADHRAKVALCLDISASMHSLYKNGSIDALVERVLALGFRFDDDGEIDVFLFGKKSHVYGSLGVDNYQNCTKQMLRQHPLEGGTYYGKVMADIRKFYAGTTLPVYIMFVTDGATLDEKVTEKELKEASKEPLFWQFMAINKSGRSGGEFRFLEKLDDMRGRYVDNADFFQVTDPLAPSDEEMYNLMAAEYPNWYRLICSKGML